jgi:iron complex outermembrane receptor protein
VADAKSSDDGMAQVIVTGTRERGVDAGHSANPITVISADALAATGQTDLRDALIQIMPSVSRQAQGTTTGQLTDSISLRGLNPNQTLVLVNGKRWHTTANINKDAGPLRGSTPVDLDLIPAALVDHIEVLRDGASAQYGADAVAGVINVILKTDDHGGTIQNSIGAYSAGDGLTNDLSADAGGKLGDTGFVHFSVGQRHKEHTDRGEVDTLTGVHDSKIMGDAASDRESFGVNAGYDTNAGITIYGNVNYARRNADAYQIYRLPTVLHAVYPEGFSPVDTLQENNFGSTVGVKGGDLLGWHWDASSTYGGDYDSFGMKDSANVNLYNLIGQTPTSFHLMSVSATQWTNNVDLTRPIDLPIFSAPLNLAIGGERRNETYGLTPGDFGSYAYGGSQATPGLLPSSAGNFFRSVSAGYIDLAQKLTPEWLVDVAGRFEHYTDFGDTHNGKVATRYDFTPRLAVRGTVSTGTRAPTLAEEHFTGLSVGPTSASGLLATNSVGAAALGASPLRPERATNYTVGVVTEPISKLHLSADAYQINIHDRIVDGGTASGAAAVNALTTQGISLPSGLSPSSVAVSYFTNGASTRTRGIDLSADYRTSLGNWGGIRWDAAVNFNRTNITRMGTNASGNPLLNAQQIAYLTSVAPHNKVILGGSWFVGDWDINLHEVRYGSIRDMMTIYTGPNAYSTKVFQPYVSGAQYETNLEVGYNLSGHWHLAVGANNLFDSYPAKVSAVNRFNGVTIYDRYAMQSSLNGGFYYAKAKYTF